MDNNSIYYLLVPFDSWLRQVTGIIPHWVAQLQLMNRNFVGKARKYYKAVGAENKLKTIYFDENGGGHGFPPTIKKEVFDWLDQYLKE